MAEPRTSWLSDEQVAKLLAHSLKPEAIAGDLKTQTERVDELLSWFARFADGHANPKWAVRHAMELAYFIATTSRFIEFKPFTEKAFLEGCNVDDNERDLLRRMGILKPKEA